MTRTNQKLSSNLHNRIEKAHSPRWAFLYATNNPIERQTKWTAMTSNSQKIKFFRQRIPAFECVPGCHDCCGPVTTSTDEMARLPRKSDQEHASALAELSCPHLGEKGCEVYEERPIICRLFGTTPQLVCPNGRRPDVLTDPKLEQQIQQFFRSTRHVLV
jgi:hypothetical protein